MKSLLGVAAGCALAVMIACGGAQSKSAAPQMKPQTDGGGIPGGDGHRRAEIDKLDGDITAEMTKLGVQRPTPPPDACTSNCATAMATAVSHTQEQNPPDCKPGKGEVCTESCTLKTNICDNANKICRIAQELGGNDSYANGKCNEGDASCKAAEKRCCSCI